MRQKKVNKCFLTDILLARLNKTNLYIDTSSVVAEVPIDYVFQGTDCNMYSTTYFIAKSESFQYKLSSDSLL